ncbi:MAG: hypothetical protein R2733_25775 [Acidimicrobiales bacterium]
MTPTLWGRLQTRIILLLTVGLGWTIIVTPFLPSGGAPLGEVYRTTLSALAVVLVVGVIFWEPIYHGLQQLRWEKDWPTGIGLVTGISEGVSTLVVLSVLRDVPTTAFWLHFLSTWFLVWITLHGPLRIVALRWRYRGGRFV